MVKEEYPLKRDTDLLEGRVTPKERHAWEKAWNKETLKMMKVFKSRSHRKGER